MAKKTDKEIKKALKELKSWKSVFIGCIIVWLLFIGLTHLVSLFYEKPNEATGLLGDNAGAVNALFSALAFAGVIIAIILQKNELELQRKELVATTNQLKAQREEFEEQNKTLRRQRFENTFFQMMSLQQEIVNNLSCGNIKGRELFETLFDLQSRSAYYYMGRGYTIKNALFNFGAEVYDKIPDYPQLFDHYFRHLYRIIKYVDTTDLIEKDDKYPYTCMVRATLSRYELVWLFYNSLIYTKFKTLIEDYALLKNMRDELLAKPEHKDLYEAGAYEYNPLWNSLPNTDI